MMYTSIIYTYYICMYYNYIEIKKYEKKGKENSKKRDIKIIKKGIIKSKKNPKNLSLIIEYLISL